jgi:cellulose synthase/poly-beta-1,6-N-acetylglucosamine synthase-like glycosyltransferase
MIITLLLVVHPFVTYPLSLLVLARLYRAEPVACGTATKAPASVDICMSAYNEERVIVAKIETLLAMAERYPGPVTVNVYVDGASDATADLLAPYRDRATIVVSADRRGKTFGLNTLVEQTRGELIMFTDANVVSDADALAGLAAPFADTDIGLVSARLRYNNPDESATSRSGAAYWEVEETIKRIESRTIGLIGVDGAMFMVRRQLHAAPPDHLIDDLYVSLQVLIRGARIVSVDSVTVYERSAVLAGEEFMRKRRIACQAWNVHRTLWPQLRRMPALRIYSYVSHRLMKWLTPLFVAVAGVSFMVLLAAVIGAGALAALVVGGAIGLALAYRWHFPPAAIAVSVISSLLGVAVGIGEAMVTTRTYTVWRPAGSVRAQAGSGQN